MAEGSVNSRQNAAFFDGRDFVARIDAQEDAPPWPEGLKIAKTPIAGERYERRIGMVWLRASARLRLIRAFVEEFSAIS